MKSITSFLMMVCLSFFLQSCEFNCSVGKKDEVKGNSTVKDDGARIYNNIQLKSSGVKLNKAYLVFENGDRVPDNNATEFKSPVKMRLLIDSGWVENKGKVVLGASEKIIAEDGTVLLDEADLFSKYPDGLTANDAKVILLTADIKIRENIPPTLFTVLFKVWDKAGTGYIEGSYKLYSK